MRISSPASFLASLIAVGLVASGCGPQGPTPNRVGTPQPALAPPGPSTAQQTSAEICRMQSDVDTDHDGICDKQDTDPVTGDSCANNKDCNGDGIEDGKDDSSWMHNHWELIALPLIGVMGAWSITNAVQRDSVWSLPWKNSPPSPETDLGFSLSDLFSGQGKLATERISASSPVITFLTYDLETEYTSDIILHMSQETATQFDKSVRFCMRSEFRIKESSIAKNSTGGYQADIQLVMPKPLAADINPPPRSISKTEFDGLCASRTKQGIWLGLKTKDGQYYVDMKPPAMIGLQLDPSDNLYKHTMQIVFKTIAPVIEAPLVQFQLYSKEEAPTITKMFGGPISPVGNTNDLKIMSALIASDCAAKYPLQRDYCTLNAVLSNPWDTNASPASPLVYNIQP